MAATWAGRADDSLLAGCGGGGEDLATFDGTEGWYALQADTCGRALPAGSLGDRFTQNGAARAPMIALRDVDAQGNAMICQDSPTGPDGTERTITVRMDVYRVAGAACRFTEVLRIRETAPEPTRSVDYGAFRLLGPEGCRVHQFGTGDRYLAFFCDGNLEMNVDLQLDNGTAPKNIREVAETAVHGLARTARDAVRKENFTAKPRVEVSGGETGRQVISREVSWS